MKKMNFSAESLEPMFEKVARLTGTQRMLICVGAFLLLIGGFFYLSYMPKFEEIDRLNVKRQKLEDELRSAKKNARELPRYKQEMREAEANFRVAMNALPETKEIPSLLENVSQSGQDSGLEFLLFKPESDKIVDFYAEIPVSLHIKGGYHNLAQFFDKVAKLSRIVNVRDIKIESNNRPLDLDIKCTAVTYRFLEAEVKTEPKK